MSALLTEIEESDAFEPYFETKYKLYMSLSAYFITDIILVCLLCQFIKTLIIDRYQSFDDNNNPKNTQIAKALIKITGFYLMIVLLFSIIMTISRLMILFGYSMESCIAAPLYLIIIIISKLTIFILYLSRIKISFNNTLFAYQSSILYFVSLFITIAFIFSFCFGILYVQYLYDNNNNNNNHNNNDQGLCILKPQQLLVIVFPIISIETCSWFIILWLFLFKLHQIIINTHLKEKDEMVSIRKNQFDHIRSELDPIISAMSRLSISILISLIGQIILYLFLWPFYPGIAICVLIICNTLSVIYCFKHYRKCYKFYCYPCDHFCKSLLYRFIYTKKIIQHRNRAPTLS